MSDPFGGGHVPPPNPYVRQGGPSLDGVAVAALACSLTCCAAPVAIGLGIAGIVRTRDERRSGRWMAVTGLVLGVLLTLGLAAGVTGLVLLEQRTYYFDDAQAGDCLDIEDRDGDGEWLDVRPADCDEAHDGEVVHAGRFTAELRASYIDDPAFCDPLARAEGYGALIARGTHRIDPIVESDDAESPEVGDYFVCVAEETNGGRMTGPLPRREARGDERQDDGGDRETISSLDLARGDCFNEPKRADDGLVGTVTRVPCTRPHDLQVVGNIVLPKGSYPGEEVVDARADGCLDKFRDFLDIAYDDSRFELSYYTPTADSWRRDRDRTITCLAEHPRGKKLKQDLEGIAR